MCIDACMDVCVGVCVDVCVDLCINMCIGGCVDVCIDACIDLCINMCMDMCIDICIGVWIEMCMEAPPGLRSSKHLLKTLARAGMCRNTSSEMKWSYLFFGNCFGACRRRTPRSRADVKGAQKARLAATLPMPHSGSARAPRRSPSACSERVGNVRQRDGARSYSVGSLPSVKSPATKSTDCDRPVCHN